MHTHFYRLLDYFVHIVDSRSLQDAAKRLNVSAPVISKALSDLEDKLQQTLVIRSRGKFELTASGKKVFDHAKAMVTSATTAINSIEIPAGNLTGNVVVTVPTELSLYWLPKIIKKFKDQHPLINISVLALDEEVDLVRLGCDFALRAEFQLKANITSSAFRRLQVKLVCSPALLVPERISSKKRIESLPFIGFGFRNTNQQLNAIHIKSRNHTSFKTNPVMLTNSAIYGKEMALHEQGMSLVLSTSVEKELKQGKLVSVAEDYNFGYVDLRLIYRDPYPDNAARALGMFIENYDE